ncbi:hypothetical protein FA15DRAFT_729590 [Coprinopsis marcescibilis]|uniref:F-box domain-containing protein n=1 Tax=Coprinopsis marcescibilis TaxID=230819 RepID=A0A5C3L1N7_COPMA|nr:hypothetical protein FA15DRAFT_729590 [Coprinopsis marcescibilis]
MGATQSFQLPNALYTLIVQNLDPDDAAIHSLSLMSQFNKLANTFLYKSIKIDLSNVKGDILAHKLAFTLAEKPELARLIKHLALRRGKDEVLYRYSLTMRLERGLFGYTDLQLQYIEHLRQTTPYTTETKILLLIFTSAKGLIQFELEYRPDSSWWAEEIAWTHLKPELQEALKTVLLNPTIQKKTISGINALPANLIKALPTKEVKLSMIGVAISGLLSRDSADAEAHEDNVEKKSSVELELSDGTPGATFHYLTSPSFLAHRNIRTFAYSSSSSRGFPRLQAALDVLAPTLTMFSMMFISGAFDHRGFEKLDLSQLQLEAVYVSFSTNNLSECAAKAALEILGAVGNGPSSSSSSRRCLRSIEVSVTWGMIPWAPDSKHHLQSVGDKLIVYYK